MPLLNDPMEGFAISIENNLMKKCLKIEKDQLPKMAVFENAEMIPLAFTADGVPAVFQLLVEKGIEVPPHATESGTRLISVVSGTLYWGNGESIDPDKEELYTPGDVLLVPPKAMHWLAARKGDLILQGTLLDSNSLVPEIHAQLQRKKDIIITRPTK